MTLNRINQLILFASLAASVTTMPGCHSMSSCIKEGTLISTPEGPRPIESLRIGDQVWTLSANRERQVGQVVGTRTASVDEIIDVQASTGPMLSATQEHPVSVNGSWVPMGQLTPDMPLTVETGDASIESIKRRRGKTAVVDLTVTPNSNFFANGILVHNKTVMMPAEEKDLIGTWLFIGQDSYWYRLDLEAGGKGTARMALYTFGPRRHFERRDVEFVSWSMNRLDVEVRLRTWDNRLIIMKGMASDFGVGEEGYFRLDGMTLERPDRFMERLRVLGILMNDGSTSKPASP